MPPVPLISSCLPSRESPINSHGLAHVYGVGEIVCPFLHPDLVTIGGLIYCRLDGRKSVSPACAVPRARHIPIHVPDNRRDLGHEGVRTACHGTLDGILRGKVCGGSKPCNVSVTFVVHSDAVANIIVSAAQVGGVEEDRTVGIELCHKAVIAARIGTLNGILRGKVCRGSKPCNVSVTFVVHSDATALVP